MPTIEKMYYALPGGDFPDILSSPDQNILSVHVVDKLILVFLSAFFAFISGISEAVEQNPEIRFVIWVVIGLVVTLGTLLG